MIRGSEVELRAAQPSVPPSTSTHTPTTLLVAQVTVPLAALAGAAVAASPAAASAAIASPDPIRLLIVDIIINLSMKRLDVIYTKVLCIAANFLPSTKGYTVKPTLHAYRESDYVVHCLRVG